MSLSIDRERTVGIIGPNGSGKSTLIKCFLGLVTPTEGTISINGYLLNGSSEYRRSIGYVPQIARFPQDLTGQEIIGIIRGLRSGQAPLEPELIERFDLRRELGKRTRAMSGGTRQKLSAVLACMYDPELLILDEPTAGLDPVSNSQLKEYILSLKMSGRTVLLTTHIMNDLEELADDVIILLEGRIRFFGAVRDLREQTGVLRLDMAVARLLERGAA